MTDIDRDIKVLGFPTLFSRKPSTKEKALTLINREIEKTPAPERFQELMDMRHEICQLKEW